MSPTDFDAFVIGSAQRLRNQQYDDALLRSQILHTVLFTGNYETWRDIFSDKSEYYDEELFVFINNLIGWFMAQSKVMEKTDAEIKELLDDPEQFVAFLFKRQLFVNKQVATIADEYGLNGEKAALTMLNDIIMSNNLKVWEASVLSQKVVVLLRERGYRMR